MRFTGVFIKMYICLQLPHKSCQYAFLSLIIWQEFKLTFRDRVSKAVILEAALHNELLTLYKII